MSIITIVTNLVLFILAITLIIMIVRKVNRRGIVWVWSAMMIVAVINFIFTWISNFNAVN